MDELKKLVNNPAGAESGLNDGLAGKRYLSIHYFLLDGERVHQESRECWCKPYQDEQNKRIWIHNEMPSGRA
jgi:hypothetical protein